MMQLIQLFYRKRPRRRAKQNRKREKEKISYYYNAFVLIYTEQIPNDLDGSL